MTYNEIVPYGLYYITLDVIFREEIERKKIKFMIRVSSKSKFNETIEFTFLNDNSIIHYAYPYQLSKIE
jgi:hypothetical protein